MMLSVLVEEVAISLAIAHGWLRTMVVAARATMNHRLDLRYLALHRLHKLTEETSKPVLPYGNDAIFFYSEQVKILTVCRIFTQSGRRTSLYCTAACKAVLTRFSSRPEGLETAKILQIRAS